MSVGDRRIIEGKHDRQSLLAHETSGGFLFSVYEDGVYAAADLTTKDAALLVKWLRERIEGTDE